MTKSPSSITTLLPDLRSLLSEGAEVSAGEKDALGMRLSRVLRDRMSPQDRSQGGGLRLSKIGSPDRRLWYDANKKHKPREKDEPEWRMRAAFGDMTEELLLFLCEKAGHLVTDRQRTVSLDGVEGHIDCLIDGVLVDVKSTSPYGFYKFQRGTMFEPYGDPFGYIEQLSAYNQALGLGDQSAYWLVMNKSDGSLLLRELTDVEQINGTARIKDARAAVTAKGNGPTRCYPLVPEGKSGNMAIHTHCSWCPYKADCYKKANGGQGIRTFKYAKEEVELAVVKKEPRVPEVKR